MFCSSCGQQNNQDSKFCSKCGSQLHINRVVPSLTKNPNRLEVTQYAGFWKRFAAFILDTLIVVTCGFLLGLIIGSIIKVPNDSSFQSLLNLIGIIISWIYFAVMESSDKQATLGKMALGIKVVDLEGNRISFGRASGRFVAHTLSNITLGIGYLIAAFTKRNQALHDMVAGCLVVNSSVTPINFQQNGAKNGMSTKGIIALILVGLFPIIGILAAIAIPAYQDYTVRGKTSDLMIVGNHASKAVEEYFNKNNSIPTDIGQTGFNKTSPYIKNVMVNGENGVVYVIANFPPLEDKYLSFVPSLGENKMIIWKCESESIPKKYLPQNCS